MLTSLTNPNVIKTFGHNLNICLRLIGSRPESLVLRCNTSLDVIQGFKQGLGELSEQLLAAICTDIDIPKEEILLEHQNLLAAEQYFEGIFLSKGKLTATSLLGANKTEGDEVMASQTELSQGKLNDPGFRVNFGLNVQTCLNHIGMKPKSLALRLDMAEGAIDLLLVGKLSLSNDDIEAIRSEMNLSTNDLIMDNGRRFDVLLAKLKAAGRIKPTEPMVGPGPEHQPATAVSSAVVEIEVPREESTLEPIAVMTQAIMAEIPQTMEISTMTDIWDSDDVVAHINGQTFKLRDKEYRKVLGKRIIELKNKQCPNEGWVDILNKCHIDRLANWIHAVSYGQSLITGTEIESFAEFFQVPVLSLLTGEFAETEHVSVVAKVPDKASEPQSNLLPTKQEPESETVPTPAAVEPSSSVQEHFKRHLTSTEYELADDVTPRDFLVATLSTPVDWCTVFCTITKDGVAIVKEVESLLKRFGSTSPDLQADIFRHVLSVVVAR